MTLPVVAHLSADQRAMYERVCDKLPKFETEFENFMKVYLRLNEYGMIISFWLDPEDEILWTDVRSTSEPYVTHTMAYEELMRIAITHEPRNEPDYYSMLSNMIDKLDSMLDKYEDDDDEE